MFKTISAAALALAIGTGSAGAATLGTVVAFGDEWTLSNSAFGTDAANTGQLTSNLAALLGGTSYLIATANALAYGSSFETALATAGKSVTRTNSDAGLAAGLGTADVVLLSGTVGTGALAQLHAFVGGGGSVVVSLGTGDIGGSPVSEAAAWNPFLNTYGLNADASWTYTTNVLNLPVAIDGPTSLDDGVTRVIWGYGNQISLFGPDPAEGLVTLTQQTATVRAIGVSVGGETPAVPVPASLPLLLAGAGGLLVLRGRRRA